MITKRGLYHKKCFSCISCRCQLHYYGAIEGPDDEIYCRVCYLKAYGPGGKNKYGDATPYPVEDEEAPDCCIRCGSKVKWHFLAIKTLEIPYGVSALFELRGSIFQNWFLTSDCNIKNA